MNISQKIHLAKSDKDAIHQRLLFLVSVFFCFWLLLVGRIAYLQLFLHSRLAGLNRLRLEQTIELAGERGGILDRHGNRIAFSVQVDSLVGDPMLIKDISKTARILGEVLSPPPSPISFAKKLRKALRKAKGEGKQFIWIAPHVDPRKRASLEKYKLSGVYFIKDWKRIYPYPHLFSHITGFISKDGRGLEGLEYYWEKILKSSQKQLRVKRDAKGRSLFSEELLFNPLNYEGYTLRLTLDSSMQYFLKEELKRALEFHSAESALGLILDAKTAAVQAISSVLKKKPILPSFNLSPFYQKNRVVTDAFEQGSTMKTFVLAGLLREGLLSPKDIMDLNRKYYCEDGLWELPQYKIRESHPKGKWDWLNIQEILARSSNICISKLAFSLGANAYYQVLKDFGFGEKTGIDFPGEIKGKLHLPPWTPYQLSRIAFGHNITASALQVARAYVAIANGGMLMQPYLLESLLIPPNSKPVSSENKNKNKNENKVNFSSGPYPLRRVLTEEQAHSLKKLLEGVVSPRGTGYRAVLPGNRAGGKTGTAQRVDLKRGGYFANKYISIFVGFAPVENPRHVVYIAVNSPQKGYYASSVAAPVFARVTSYLLRRSSLSSTSQGEGVQKPFSPSVSVRQSPPSVPFTSSRSLAGKDPFSLWKKIPLRQLLLAKKRALEEKAEQLKELEQLKREVEER